MKETGTPTQIGIPVSLFSIMCTAGNNLQRVVLNTKNQPVLLIDPLAPTATIPLFF